MNLCVSAELATVNIINTFQIVGSVTFLCWWVGQYNNLLNKVFDQMEMVGTRVLNKRSMMVSLASLLLVAVVAIVPVLVGGRGTRTFKRECDLLMPGILKGCCKPAPNLRRRV